MTDSYLPGKFEIDKLRGQCANMTVTGAIVLAHSLRNHGAKRQLGVLVTLDTVSAASIEQLKVSSNVLKGYPSYLAMGG